MEYIYDIVLNFQNDYYDFYEWKKNDKILNIKKILVYKTNNKNYLNLKYNNVIIDNHMLPPKTKMFLITNGYEVMGILLDNHGKILKRSSLLLDESEEVIEEQENIKVLPLKYKKIIMKEQSSVSRIITEKNTFLEKYFSNIDIKKDEYLLKYIYYEIYNKEEKNINIIYQNLKKLIKEDIDKIYNGIKKISIELKK